MRHRLSRSGFSLSSLVVVIAIIGLVIALMLPAVQKVRDAAARAKSQNNLKQIALAFHGYTDANGFFPAGVDKDNNSALVYLLPYIEQDNVHRIFLDKGRKAIEGTRIKVYESDRDPLFMNEVTQGLAPTNYFFSAGSEYALKDNNGLTYRESKLKFVDVTDGLSNTVLVGESLRGDGGAGDATVARRHVRLKSDALKKLTDKDGVEDFKAGKNLAGDRGASWADGRFLQATYTGTRTVNAEEPDVDCGGLGGLSALRMPGGGVNAALADGSVRFISNTLDIETWKALHTRAGGETIKDF